MIQNQFINKLLTSGDTSLITVNNLTDDFFSDYPNEFNYIKDFLKKYGKIPDEMTFINQFPNFDLIEVKETNEYLLDALYEDRNQRYLTSAHNKARDLIINGKIDETLYLLQNTVEKLTQAKHLEAIDIFSDTSRYDNFVERSTNFTNFYISTGLKELDDILGGWDRKEENAVIMARPGIGKSWILMKTAVEAAKQGLRVGLYEGEISVDKTGRRIDTLYAHLPNGKLNHGDVALQVEYKKYFENVVSDMKDKLYVLTPNQLGRPATVGDLRAFIDKYKLEMLCVDQYSLLEDERKGRTTIDKTSNISRDIKNLQVLTQIPIISVTQQNREKPEDGNANTANTANSDRISQDATILLALEKKDDILKINIAKSRDGGDGRHLRYIVDLNHGNFTFLPDEKDATDGAKCEDLKNEYEYDIGEQNPEDKPF